MWKLLQDRAISPLDEDDVVHMHLPLIHQFPFGEHTPDLHEEASLLPLRHNRPLELQLSGKG